MSSVNSSKQTVLEINNVSFSYGNNEVLYNINLKVKKGDYLGLIGPNGGGKTTLMKLSLNLLKPTAGSIGLFGIDITQFKEWHRIGYISQKAADFDPLFPATVQDVVLMGRYARRGLFKPLTPEDYQKVGEALKSVNLLAFRTRRVGDLSGGQKQRVFIARALASDPEIIMLDEPTTGVDQETQEHFYDLLKTLNEKLKLTLILVSHDLERVAHEATRIASVHKTLSYYKNPADALKNEPHSVHQHH